MLHFRRFDNRSAIKDWAVRSLCPTVVVALMLAALAAATVQAEEYTLDGGAIGAEQVARGQEHYNANCAACHGADMHSVVSTAPDLTGAVFRFNWLGEPVGDKFDVIRMTMPAGNPGALSDQAYVDIVAYILSFNGVHETEGELPPDFETLQAITVTQP